MNLNSFNDVAAYIAKENERLSQGIVNTLRNEISTVRNELKTDMDTIAHNLKSEMRSEVDATQSSFSLRITRMEDIIARTQRNSEVVISGIPVVLHENCIELVAKIATVIGFPRHSDETTAFRLNKTGVPNRSATTDPANHNNDQSAGNSVYPLIMVKFSSSTAKSNFMGKYLAYKSLCLKDIGFESERRIFIKENLTPMNYKIFKACATAKSHNLISKYHTRDGVCFVSLPSSDKLIAVHSISFLNGLIGNKSPANETSNANNRRTKRKHDNDSYQTQPTVTKKSRNQRQHQLNLRSNNIPIYSQHKWFIISSYLVS